CAQIHVERALEHRFRSVEQSARGAVELHARVVEQHVERAPALAGRARDHLRSARVGEVGSYDGETAPLGIERAPRRFEPRRIARRAHELGAFGEERPRRFETNPARDSGDEDATSSECAHAPFLTQISSVLLGEGRESTSFCARNRFQLARTLRRKRMERAFPSQLRVLPGPHRCKRQRRPGARGLPLRWRARPPQSSVKTTPGTMRVSSTRFRTFLSPFVTGRGALLGVSVALGARLFFACTGTNASGDNRLRDGTDATSGGAMVTPSGGNAQGGASSASGGTLTGSNGSASGGATPSGTGGSPSTGATT